MLSTHAGIYADPAGAYQQNGEKCGEVSDSRLMDDHGLSLMDEEDGYRHLDGQDHGCKPGEQAQHQQQCTEYFCENGEDEGPPVPDMQWVGKGTLHGAEMCQLGKSVIKDEEYAKAKTERQCGDIKGAVGIGGRQEFLHVIEFGSEDNRWVLIF